ncbi:ATP-binding protein [Bacillus marasmi]|uniref:ATP-binding protein n=1 Tax=Bacillus marasmi TaxID=1926279 RepID=UPI0011C7BAE5|nr:ATP-binding protein [Bacillus marasmi]
MNNTIVNQEDTHKTIKLDAKLLSSTEPNLEINPESELLRFKEKILYGPPSCYVITGYRGVGKTSFIELLKNRIHEDLKRKNTHSSEDDEFEDILFVNCNFVQGDTKENILRKLIRQLVSATKEHLPQKLEKNPDIEQELSLLYNRTFYSVVDNQKRTIENKFNWGVSLSLIIPLVLMVIIFFSNISLSFRQEVSDFYELIKDNPKYIPAGTAILGLFSIASLLIGKGYENKEVDEKEVKTLYDDEIAEVRLQECIHNLAKLKIKIIFILDELDKFKNDVDLDKFLGELKPILINGKASFLLVTGQVLSKSFEKAFMEDDAILPSIISDTIHVPLPDKASFDKVFEKLTNYSEKNNHYQHYLHSAILRSTRVPRKFFNIIRKDSKWDNTSIPPKPYIEISKENLKIYERDTEILRCISSVITKYHETTKNPDPPLIDFLISRLHLYADKIKSMGAASFQIEDINKIDQDIKDKWPTGHREALDTVLQAFLEEMDNRKILDYSEEASSYSFTELIQEENTLELTAKQFLKEAERFELFLKGIYKEVFASNGGALYNILKELHSAGIMNERNFYKISNIIAQKQELLTVKNNEDIEIGKIRNLEREIKIFTISILERFTYHIIENTLNKEKYLASDGVKWAKAFSEAGQRNVHVPDYIITKAPDHNVPDIIVEIKLMENAASRLKKVRTQIEEILSKLDVLEKPIKLILIFYHSSTDNKVQSLTEDTFFTLGLSPKVSLEIISPNIYRDKDKPLRDYLLEIFNKIDKE